MATDRRFWFKWMFYYSLGEFLAIVAAAMVGGFLFINLPGEPLNLLTTLILLGMAGCVEGLVIGWIQWKSFSKVLLHLHAAPWITITILAAISGWLLILPPAVVLISVLAKFTFITNYSSMLYTALVGSAFGAIMGIAQFIYLRKFYRGALAWVLANVLGWMFSFLIMYAFISMLIQPGSFAYNIFLFVISCILSGITHGLITGTTLHYFMTVKSEHLPTPLRIGSSMFAGGKPAGELGI